MILLPILLFNGFKPTVAVNEKVTAGQPLAKKSISGKDEIIHVSKDLSVPVKKVTKVLKKSLGSKISKGDILAVKKGKFGIGKKQLISEFNGTLVKLDEKTGDLLVRVVVDEVIGESLLSPVDGIIEKITDKEIVLKTEKIVILAEDACGKNTKGELLVINKKEIEDEDIKKEVDGKIIAGQSFEKAAIFKILAIGGLGVITINNNDSAIGEILEKKLSGSIFLLTEDNFKKVEKYQGKEIYLDLENKSIVVL